MLNPTRLPLFFLAGTCLSLQTLAQEGKDGIEIITAGNVVFNRYSHIVANAPSGSNTIRVNSAVELAGSALPGAENNPYTTDTLGYGDLIMVIKMQGAEISTNNDATYGAILNYRNTGRYELRVVHHVSNDVIYLCGNLVFDYMVGGNQRAQVVRVPRVSGVTVAATGVLTGLPWNGTTGGVVALESSANVLVDGQIQANAIGFRGGALEGDFSKYGIASFFSADGEDGGEKGEGIGGSVSDYDLLGGRYGRGAAANGGGGGNAHNAAGGGGANAGDVATWTGQGNPVAGHGIAWNLESPSFATHSSSGGGRGGYTYRQEDDDATITIPGHIDWGGDDRRNVGGYGGRPLVYDINTLFMGGGGGAADANNDCGGAGGNGGGIIYILAHGAVSGSGQISAAGGSGHNTSNLSIDAAGGAGAGGAIRLNIAGTISGVSISADGGKGGDQLWVHTMGEAEGPGGGGGGGYVITTGIPTAGVSTAGGFNGVTYSDALTEFSPNGATAGDAGIVINNTSFVAAPPLHCSVLPVKLTSFSAYKTQSGVAELVWTATGEETVNKYVVEQQGQNGQWKDVAAVPAKRLTIASYRLQQNLLPGVNHFRLRIAGIGQQAIYSTVKTVRAENAGTNIRISTSGGFVHAQNLSSSVRTFQVINAGGMIVKQGSTSGSKELSIGTQQWPAGVYYLIFNSGVEVYNKAFVVR